MIVVAFVRVWLSLSWCGESLCRLSTTFWFSSLWYDVYLCLGNSNEQNIFDQRQKIKLMVVSMLHNKSQRC